MLVLHILMIGIIKFAIRLITAIVTIIILVNIIIVLALWVNVIMIWCEIHWIHIIYFICVVAIVATKLANVVSILLIWVLIVIIMNLAVCHRCRWKRFIRSMLICLNVLALRSIGCHPRLVLWIMIDVIVIRYSWDSLRIIVVVAAAIITANSIRMLRYCICSRHINKSYWFY